MAMNIDFTGKTVLVTGGGRGLGKEMALQFAGCGANVYIANRKEDHGLATVKEIEALGVKGGFTKCDVAVEEDASSHRFCNNKITAKESCPATVLLRLNPVLRTRFFSGAAFTL